MQEQKILIGHGAGGKLSQKLIHEVFVKHFNNSHLRNMGDSSIVETTSKTAFSVYFRVLFPWLNAFFYHRINRKIIEDPKRKCHCRINGNHRKTFAF